jgi:prevent-host-death family protein
VYQIIQATEAARGFSDIINRARYRGESFVVVRNGEAVAQIIPPKARTTFADLAKALRGLPKIDPGFGDDVRALQGQQPEAPPDPWGF